MVFLVMLFIILFTTILWYVFHRERLVNLPPGPFNWPIIGSLHRVGPLPHVSLHELSRKYGSIFYMKLGTVPYVILNSAEVIKEAYARYPVEMADKLPTIAGEVCGMNYSGLILARHSPSSILLRKLLNMHMLSASRLKAYEDVRKQELMVVVNNIYQRTRQGVSIQVRPLLHSMNMNVVTYMLFGERFFGSSISQGVNTEFVSIFTQALHLIKAPNISEYIPQLRWLDLNGVEKKYREFMPQMKKVLGSILEKRKRILFESKNSEPATFVDILISREDVEMPGLSKLALIFDLIIATVDSTATALEWNLAELVSHRDILERCQEEIQRVVGTERWIEEADLPKLKFLDAVVKENLRLHIPGPLPIPRIFETQVEIGGYTIPAGTAVLPNFYAAGMDEKQWEKPFEFVPERFMESKIDVFGADYNMLPFGTGRRVCPGAKFAFNTLKMNMGVLLQGFEWECGKVTMDAVYSTVNLRAQPLEVRASPRMHAEFYHAP